MGTMTDIIGITLEHYNEQVTYKPYYQRIVGHSFLFLFFLNAVLWNVHFAVTSEIVRWWAQAAPEIIWIWLK